MLEVTGLRKSYGQLRALKGVDLRVEAGEIVGLLGPNGAGKTSLVSIVAGLRRADAGTVRVGGLDALRHPEAVRPLLGLAPQELGIYPNLTVAENLAFFADLAGLRRGAVRAAVDETAAAVGLAERLPTRAGTLSGGQKRRLHSAMALIGRPPLLLLDEPTAGADVETRAQLLDIVFQRARDGAAVVYSTHYLPEIETLGAGVAILAGGRILASGSVAELVARHAHPQLRLTFQGTPPPQLKRWLGAEATVVGHSAHISTPDPERLAAAALDKAAARLTGLEIIRPSLESVYLAVVGTQSEEALRAVPA